MNKSPLVSCVMPTWNRRGFIPAAIDCWLKQTYENRELIVLDDGDDPIVDLVPSDARIRYVAMEKKQLTGTKLNRCCELARGEIICRFDDDDWSAPERVADQVDRLFWDSRPVTGYGHLYFWNVPKGIASLYLPKWPDWIAGTSMCFTREYWKKHRFADIHQGSDSKFIAPLLGKGIINASPDPRYMVARSHAVHPTWPRDIVGKVVPKDSLPQGFWANEKLIQASEELLRA